MLTDQQKQFYADNGYVLVPGLFTPEEAALYRREAHDLAHRLSAVREINATWGSADSVSKGKATQLLHCHDVQFQSATFTRMLVNEKFTEAAADIIGPNVQLHHTKMFIKPPEKGSPFPMHQDSPFFPHENHSMIAAIIHFDDAPVERGRGSAIFLHVARPDYAPTEGCVALPLPDLLALLRAGVTSLMVLREPLRG